MLVLKSRIILLQIVLGLLHGVTVCSLSFLFSRCDNGTESIGCGPQEEFRSCADIAIHSADGEIHLHSLEGEIVFVIITSLGGPLYQFYADRCIDAGKIPFGIEYNVRLLEIHTIQLFGHKSGHCERLFTTHMIFSHWSHNT